MPNMLKVSYGYVEALEKAWWGGKII